MSPESCCGFCAKLKVTHHAGTGRQSRCPVCKTPLVAYDSGTTYRLVEEDPAELSQRPGLFKRLWKSAVSLVMAVSLLLAWIASRPSSEAMPVKKGTEQPQVVAATTKSSQPAPSTRPVANPQASVVQEVSPPELARTAAKPAAGQSVPSLMSHASPPTVPTSDMKQYLVRKAAAKQRADEPNSLTKSWLPRRAAPLPSRSFIMPEEHFLTQLQSVPEVGLDTSFKAPALAQNTGKRTADEGSRWDHAGYIAALKKHSTDLDGMPFIDKNCQLASDTARVFGERAQFMRSVLNSAKVNDVHSLVETRISLFEGGKGRNRNTGVRAPLDPAISSSMGTKHTVAPLQQLVMAEQKELRGLLVSGLADISGPEATRALARRAVFDLEDGVREMALGALFQRSADDYMGIFKESLRYPFAPVVKNAARALVYFQRREMVPQLIEMLDAPEPDAPFRDGNKWKVRELTRVNHNLNCFLCHPPSEASRESMRAVVPSTSRPLPGPFSFEYYPSFSRGEASFVRADITYLRQDFSTYQTVEKHGVWQLWPKQQRYDFFVRLRELTPGELKAWQERPREELSEHRRALLYALRELTGEDAGVTALQWRTRLRINMIGVKKAGPGL